MVSALGITIMVWGGTWTFRVRRDHDRNYMQPRIPIFWCFGPWGLRSVGAESNRVQRPSTHKDSRPCPLATGYTGLCTLPLPSGHGSYWHLKHVSTWRNPEALLPSPRTSACSINQRFSYGPLLWALSILVGSVLWAPA